MGGILIESTWKEVTRDVLTKETLSINPLELLTAAQLTLSIFNSGILPWEVKTFVIRVDKASACACINIGRGLSSKMRRALRVIVNIKEEYHLTVVAQHVQTEDNIVADCLSRGQYVLAKRYAESDGTVTWGK